MKYSIEKSFGVCVAGTVGAVVALAAACSSGSTEVVGSQINCGAGTVEVGNQCVAVGPDASMPSVDAGTNPSPDASVPTSDAESDADAATADSGPTILTLASGQNYPQGIAVDSTGVYWTTIVLSQNQGTVVKTGHSGGTPIVLAAGTFDEPYRVAIDSTNVYWTDFGGTIDRVALWGGTPVTLFNLSGEGPCGIALDDVNVYWTDNFGHQAIKRVPKDGGAASVVATDQDQATAIAVDSTSAYWTNSSSCPLEGGTCDDTNGSVRSVSLDGGTPSVLATAQAMPWAIAIDATNIYWVNQGTMANDFIDGTVMKMTLTGAAQTVLASGQKAPSAIAIDGTNVYWVNGGTPSDDYADGAVMRVPITGGAVTTLVSNQPAPKGIAIDATSVYWTNAGSPSQNYADGTAMKLTPR